MRAADDLRALSAAATRGPWDGHRHLIFEPVDDAPDGEAGAEVADVDHPEDLELIVWLRNHADALADLMWAAKQTTNAHRNGDDADLWDALGCLHEAMGARDADA